MRTILGVSLLVASAIAIAACDSGTEKTADVVNEQAPISAPAAPATLVTKRVSDNGMLTVDPAVIDSCTNTDGLIASQVSWNAAETGTEGVEVYLQGAGEDRKLWSAAGAVGVETTGPWMRDGSQVILVNGADKSELARIEIRSQACATN